MKYKTFWISLLIISALYFMLSGYIYSNSFLLSKCHVISSGYLSFKFIRSNQQAVIPKEHIGGLDTVYYVYNKNQYIGYIDRYADFIPKKEKFIPIAQLYMNFFFFFFLRIFSLFISIVSVIKLIISYIRFHVISS